MTIKSINAKSGAGYMWETTLPCELCTPVKEICSFVWEYLSWLLRATSSLWACPLDTTFRIDYLCI